MRIHHKQLAELSKLAYSGNSVNIIIGITEKGYTYVTSTSDFFVVDAEDDRIFVFKGTDNLSDMLTNIGVRKIDTLYGKFHEGFAGRMSKLQKKYSDYIDCDKNIIATGHSLGGALALMFAIENTCDVVTFGQPMVSDKLVMYPKSHIRYVNNMDIIPRLPGVGYSHHGELRHIDYAGNIHLNPSWWQLLKDKVKSRWKAFAKSEDFDDFYDHKIGEYIEKIK